MSKIKAMYLNNDAYEALEPPVELMSDEELEEMYNEYINQGGFSETSNNRGFKSRHK